jgi:hypothetical protein
MRPTSDRVIDDNSEASISHAPCIAMAASTESNSGISSVNHGSNSFRSAEDLPIPCGPSRTIM